jgi:hypothetical protein
VDSVASGAGAFSDRVDAAAEMLDIARRRLASSTVRSLQADVLTWQPPRRYDKLSDTLRRLVKTIGLPPVRFHYLRHGRRRWDFKSGRI